ncbi:MAG: T9SS type A sorting domain-containing protein [Sporocytophaga sp.]|nr:T9SS type A sorting domain-containing protein [Sporocytophaga sp.]
MKFTFLLMSGLLVYAQVNAQDNAHIVSSSGKSSSSEKYSLTFTLGEPVARTYHSENYKLSLGFIGKDLADVDLVTSVPPREDKASLSSIIFPNPVSDKFRIKGDENASYEVNIFNMQGNLISHLKYVRSNDEMDYPKVIGGCYYLEIINKETLERTFEKIIKI